LDNCEIDDEKFAILLDGMEKMDSLTKIFYKENVFSLKSFESIKGVLLKRPPITIQDLRLEHCQVGPKVIKSLVAFLVQYDIPLTALALVDVSLTEETILLIAKYVEKSFSLQ